MLLYQHHSKLNEGYNCCEIISDRCFEGSLKDITRKKRGEAESRLILNGDTLIPKDFSKDFLGSSKKKNDLGIFLSNKFMELHKTSQVLVVKIKDTVACNKTDIATESLIFHCNIEETDSKLIRHMINLCQYRYKKLIINTVDTDILKFAIAYSHKLVGYGVESYNFKFEMGDNVNVYNILQLRDTNGHVKCLALPFHHAFTGCDSTSIFYSQGNVNSWRGG